VSAQPHPASRQAEAIAGLLAALSIFGSLVALAYRPGRLVPFALLLALLATMIGGRHRRLAGLAIAIGAVCFVVGMSLAVLTDNPIY
jgi:hypothetical protein